MKRSPLTMFFDALAENAGQTGTIMYYDGKIHIDRSPCQIPEGGWPPVKITPIEHKSEGPSATFGSHPSEVSVTFSGFLPA